MSKIFCVKFRTPPAQIGTKEQTDFFFGSLTAIYGRFSVEEIGCKVSNLWNLGVSSGTPYNGEKCSITVQQLIRQKTNRGEGRRSK